MFANVRVPSPFAAPPLRGQELVEDLSQSAFAQGVISGTVAGLTFVAEEQAHMRVAVVLLSARSRETMRSQARLRVTRTGVWR